MTAIEAHREFQTITERWIDFDEWAYLQLEKRSEWSSERQLEAEEFHQEAERKLNEYKDDTMKRLSELKRRSASPDELDAFNRSRWPQLDILVNDFRRLGP
jgi:hypothetical protein